MSNVLLVEDDAWLAELEASSLVAAGHRVRTAAHGLAAVQLLDEALPEIIILDVLLAGSTAFTLLNELQSYGDSASIPVVLCTNLAEQFEASELAAYGVRRVVDKTTMAPDDLVAAVRAVLP